MQQSLDYLVIVIIISQSILTLRTVLEGAFVPMIFMGFLLFFTVSFFIVLKITKMIDPAKFLDDRHELSPKIISRWWDLYKHPLTVKSSITKQQGAEISNCKTWLTQLFWAIYSRRFIPEFPEKSDTKRRPEMKVQAGFSLTRYTIQTIKRSTDLTGTTSARYRRDSNQRIVLTRTI